MNRMTMPTRTSVLPPVKYSRIARRIAGSSGGDGRRGGGDDCCRIALPRAEPQAAEAPSNHSRRMQAKVMTLRRQVAPFLPHAQARPKPADLRWPREQASYSRILLRAHRARPRDGELHSAPAPAARCEGVRPRAPRRHIRRRHQRGPRASLPTERRAPHPGSLHPGSGRIALWLARPPRAYHGGSCTANATAGKGLHVAAAHDAPPCAGQRVSATKTPLFES